ncbi:PEP-CTERM protein-sorting domain-containing protein [Nitrosospira sp. Nl5]|uniref:PEP-CTERM sorting domain-containing protein n=1 Tax=Nitrosospira sp. Nl5 TaxID=200120 RepID=UPI0008828352|nr:PEP-CTERM sorting domain-containing protein [Nitrosospira sp. Nl5]SCY05123.1 PEP-CTERM protein-sorting domain-containing protein [Nitrosospira sp. Nl5]
MKNKLSAILFSSLVGFTFSSMAAASVTFSDSTFNLSDYSISTYQTGGADITVSQTLAGGNPGAALQVDTHIPASSNQIFYTTEYLINTTFQYDPSLQGPIDSIEFTYDAYAALSRPASDAIAVVLTQGGNIYSYVEVISGPTLGGTFETVHAAGLKAADFSLITDLKNITAVDPTQHPDFASGVLGFGVPGFYYVSGFFGVPDISSVLKVDNLSFTISAVPEPETYAMLVAGLGLVGFLGRRKNQHRSSEKLS